jgi:hypothetical protein
MLFKQIDIVPSLHKDKDIEEGPQAIGEPLGRMLRRAVHVMTFMEFLHSNTASDKRPATIDFLKELDPVRIVQLAGKYLLLFCAFRAHIEKEKSQENIMFWLDTEDFRSLGELFNCFLFLFLFF